MITVTELKAGGGRYERTEPLGGVFEAVPGRQSTPAWSFGPNKEPMYQCPISAIRQECWPLLTLWMECKALGALPLAGGVLDQPLIVRRYFPVFADEYQRIDAARRNAGMSEAAMQAAAMALQITRGAGSR